MASSECTLTLDEFAEKVLRPACERQFGVEAMRAWDSMIADGVDLDAAAVVVLAIAKGAKE